MATAATVNNTVTTTTTSRRGNSSHTMPEQSSKTFQVCVLGWPSVGKSAITHMLVEGRFIQGYTPTIENVYSKEYKMNNRTYKLKILDTMGHEQNASIRDEHVIGTRGFIIVFDLNHRATYNVVEDILDELTATLDYSPDAKEHAIILVGNKNDREDRQVEESEAKKLVDDFQLHNYIECSAKNPGLVDKVFKQLLTAMIDNTTFPEPSNPHPTLTPTNQKQNSTTTRRTTNPTLPGSQGSSQGPQGPQGSQGNDQEILENNLQSLDVSGSTPKKSTPEKKPQQNEKNHAGGDGPPPPAATTEQNAESECVLM